VPGGIDVREEIFERLIRAEIPSCAISYTDSTGRTPFRRASSSRDTAPRSGGCAGLVAELMITITFSPYGARRAGPLSRRSSVAPPRRLARTVVTPNVATAVPVREQAQQHTAGPRAEADLDGSPGRVLATCPIGR
jgi:hypothetical protein